MRHEQQAREEEQNNHVLMLRELQMLVSTERSTKEDLEQQLEDAKEQILLLKKLPGSKTEEYEHQIARLQLELQGVQGRLKKAEKASSQPSPLLVQLQDEMAKMKKENAEAVIREQKRANDAEERLRIITSLEECRVADLGMHESTFFFLLAYFTIILFLHVIAKRKSTLAIYIVKEHPLS